MCIYYGSRDGLEYKSGEHIFIAALGGKKKLDRNFVSANFNSDISRLEQDFVRNSLPSIARQIEGPGNRGRLGQRHETRSPVFVAAAEVGGAKHISLCFVQKRVAIEIPQLRLELAGVKCGFSCDQKDGNDILEILREFKLACEVPESVKLKVIVSDQIARGEVLFGIRNGVEENFNGFLAHHSEDAVQWTKGDLCSIGAQVSFGGGEPGHMRYQPTVHMQAKFNEEHFRIYAKMAFNYLAYFKGLDFVQRPLFDDVRNWIAYGGENRFAALSTEYPGWLWEGERPLPPSSHVIAITVLNGGLYAHIILYGHQMTIVQLCNDFHVPFALTGFVCDWKNGMEHDMMEYFSRNPI